jgi:hypothetical protein
MPTGIEVGIVMGGYDDVDAGADDGIEDVDADDEKPNAEFTTFALALVLVKGMGALM